MIDFHTHILPNIDDGSRSEGISQALLQREYEQGVREVVLTPHYYARKRTVEEFLTARENSFARIQAEIPEDMRVRLGAEVHLMGVNDPTDETLCKLAIEGTRCVLIELPLSSEWTEELFTRIHTFVKETEYTPVVAHVERYSCVLQDPSLLTNLAQAGCLFQVNTSAFLNKKTQKFAYKLLSKCMVHCIGTDTHDLAVRAPDYLQAQVLVVRNGYEVEFRSVQGCMKRLLAGEKVPAIYSRVYKFLGWYF